VRIHGPSEHLALKIFFIFLFASGALYGDKSKDDMAKIKEESAKVEESIKAWLKHAPGRLKASLQGSKSVAKKKSQVDQLEEGYSPESLETTNPDSPEEAEEDEWVEEQD